MSFQKHRSKGRGGNRGQRNCRPGSSPPPQHCNFANFEDGFGSTDIYLNKAIVYYVTSNLGETARIVVRNGDIYEGILRAVSSKFDCTLGEAHLIQQRKANGLIEGEQIIPNREGLISNLLIALKDIVSVNITRTDEPEIPTGIDSFTDEGITAKHTNGQPMERPLQKWVPQEEELHLSGGLEDNVKVNGWTADEMFKTNQEKFGVTSTYSDDLSQYTTPLPKDSTREMELRAEQTAREIEQSKGHSRRQEVDSGRSEEEAFASVVRPKTTGLTSLPTSTPPVTTTAAERQQVAPTSSTTTTAPDTTNTSSTSVTSTSATDSRVSTETKTTVSEDASPVMPAKDQQEVVTKKTVTSKELDPSIAELKDFHTNFKLSEKPSKKAKEVPPEPETVEKAATPSSETPPPEAVKTDDEKTSKPPDDNILAKSKLNPLAKEFKFTPKTQKPVPSPQPPQYVPVVAQPFSPTSMRPPAVPGSPYPPQQLMMVGPQQFNVYSRGKQPYNKSRSQSYGGREQGESPPYISAAAAAGSPIIAPGATFPQPVYQIPGPQVAYVQSPAGMVPQQVVPQYVVPTPHGHPRFIAPVSSPAGGASVPMTQTYQDGSHVPVYVAGNVSAIPGTATPPGQPQPSPSQQGQFIFTAPVPQMPGQPQAAGPGPAGPTQFTQGPLMYISNASVPTSTASGPVSYIAGTYPGDRIQ